MEEKKSVGRPTSYDPSFIEKADEYLAECQDDEIVFGKIKVNLPTTDGFAIFLGVARSSLYLWEKEHPEFSDALDKIRQEQHRRLLNNGLSGDYNPTIAKLILSSNHGYKEKSDITTDDGKLEGVVVLPAKE